jgi:hypothetical protein
MTMLSLNYKWLTPEVLQFDVSCLLTSQRTKENFGLSSGLLFIFIFTWQLCYLGVWCRNLAVDMPNMLPCIYQLWCNMAAMFRTWEDSTSCVHVRTWNFIQRSFFYRYSSKARIICGSNAHDNDMVWIEKPPMPFYCALWREQCYC